MKKSATLPCNIVPYDVSARHEKAISVQAGYASSYVLYESRKVYHSGRNATTSAENVYLTKFNYEHKVRNIEAI